MKKIFLCLMAVLASPCLKAQFNYTFSHHTEAYVPLTNATSVNNNQIWDEEIWDVPIGFPFNMDGIGITSLNVVAGLLFSTDVNADANGFMIMGADFVDRGFFGDTQSMSPIRYELTGTSPNRIFKLEMFNAGFYDETFIHSELNDSINLQIWLYESSDIVEFHYGDARTEYFNDYFTFDSSAVSVGYLKQVDLNTNDLEMFYYLDGDPLNPTINETNEMDILPELGVDTIPPSGMVYRFTPVPLSVENMNSIAGISLYPSPCANELYVTYTGEEKVGYHIISVTGVQMSSGTIEKGKNKIDVGQLPAGNYLIRLIGPRENRTLKFAKI